MTSKPFPNDSNWLLASLFTVMLPHLGHLPFWMWGLMLLVGTWRFHLTKNHASLGIWVILPIAAAALFGIAFSYHGLFGRDSSVALLACMLTLKLLESNNRRDFIILILGCYFLTVSLFLFNQSIFAGIYVLLPLTLLTCTLIGISHPNGQLPPRFQIGLAIKILVQGVPLMLVLFLLFPRISPLWELPTDAYSGMTGLSDSMEPGAISNLSLSDATAFRAEFKGSPPKQNQLYWRGPVLWNFDGRSWKMLNQNVDLSKETLASTGESVRYTVTLEPHNKNWLLTLDMPSQLPKDATASPELQVLSQTPVRSRIRYEAVSNLKYTLSPELNDLERIFALQLPDHENPRSLALAASWKKANLSPEAIVNKTLEMFRTDKFYYTLKPPLLGVDPIDDFLFNTKRGFCEHFSGSFVFLMRASGIPARVVTGYQGGELNPVGNYLIVRQSDAHAWSEVWLKDKGWVRVDPTAAVSPDRVESGMESLSIGSPALPIFERGDHPFLRNLYHHWDAINHNWNQWILGYDDKRQTELFELLTGKRLSWEDFTLGMIICVSMLSIPTYLFLVRKLRQPVDPVLRLYRAFQAKLARKGLPLFDHEGPVDLSERAIAHFPDETGTIISIIQHYNKLRYQSQFDPVSFKIFRRLIRDFK